MKLSAILAVTLALVTALVGNAQVPGLALKNMAARVKVYRGDLKGSVEAGTVKYLGEATAPVDNGFRVITGTKVPIRRGPDAETVTIGHILAGTVLRFSGGGDAFVHLWAETVTITDPNSDPIKIGRETNDVKGGFKTGEMIKIVWPGGSDSERTWAEVMILAVP